MEEIFELIAQMILETLSVSSFKRAKTRTWVFTVFWLIAGGILVGAAAWGAWEMRGRLIPGGEHVIWGLVAAFTAAWLVFVILGHRKNWPENWR